MVVEGIGELVGPRRRGRAAPELPPRAARVPRTNA